MKKIKITADLILSILKRIIEDEDINYTVTDKSAPLEWQGKKVSEILNVDYYTYRHKPIDTEYIVRELIEIGEQSNSLYSLNRAFCLLSIDSVERVFSKDNDTVTVSAELEYWIQVEKVKILEDLIEDINIATSGERLSILIGDKNRKFILVLGSPIVDEIQEVSEFGEMAICTLSLDIIFIPDIVNRSDYELEVLMQDSDENYWSKVPFTGLSISSSMTQKSVPKANKTQSVGSINLSNVKTIVMTFDGHNIPFVDFLINKTLNSDIKIESNSIKENDNNEAVILRLTRNEQVFYYGCVIKDHSLTVQEDTGNETHSLTLTTRGINDGSS